MLFLHSKGSLFSGKKESRESFGDLGNRQNDFRLLFGPCLFDIHLFEASEDHCLPLFSGPRMNVKYPNDHKCQMARRQLSGLRRACSYQPCDARSCGNPSTLGGCDQQGKEVYKILRHVTTEQTSTAYADSRMTQGEVREKPRTAVQLQGMMIIPA